MEIPKLKSIGTLNPHPDIPDEWLVSEPISIPFLDGKKLTFTLDDFYGDENYFADAEESITAFLMKDKKDRLEISHMVFKDYTNFVIAVGDDEDIPKIESKESVWDFVYPKNIFVSRRRRDKDIYIHIHCECEWEIEHGLQIVFRQGKKVTRVSSIDGHLTEADAYAKLDADDELLSKF